MTSSSDQKAGRGRSLLKLCIVLAIAALFALYIGTYVSRSLGGRYEPVTIGLHHVTNYAWAPTGFVTNFKWHRRPMIFYHPLYYLDCHYWHNYDDAWTDKYPVNKVDDQDAGKVHRAWQQPDP